MNPKWKSPLRNGSLGGAIFKAGRPSQRNYLMVFSLPAMLVKAELVAVPTWVIAAKQTITINASMIAYSTAVGPSSAFKKLTTLFIKFFIAHFLQRILPARGRADTAQMEFRAWLTRFNLSCLSLAVPQGAYKQEKELRRLASSEVGIQQFTGHNRNLGHVMVMSNFDV